MNSRSNNRPRIIPNSVATIRKIRNHLPRIRILFISAHRSDDLLAAVKYQGAQGLLQKPCDAEALLRSIPQVMAEYLCKKKDLGIHTEMFGDWIIDLVECGAITCTKKAIHRGKVVASFCMGSRRLYDYIDNNPFFEFYPSEYVNDPFIISQHEKMVAINVGLEIDLTGQVCADSLGYQFYSGIGYISLAAKGILYMLYKVR